MVPLSAATSITTVREGSRLPQGMGRPQDGGRQDIGVVSSAPTDRVRKADETRNPTFTDREGVVRLSAGHDSLPVIDRIKAALRQR